jgi:hypothetical protein
MIKLTPTSRLEWLLQRPHLAQAHGTINNLLSQYEDFLSVTKAGKDDLIALFLDKDQSRKLAKAANRFGDLIFEALNQIGNGTGFHRLLVV